MNMGVLSQPATGQAADSQAASIDTGLGRYMLSVYKYMAAGLSVTGTGRLRRGHDRLLSTDRGHAADLDGHAGYTGRRAVRRAAATHRRPA